MQAGPPYGNAPPSGDFYGNAPPPSGPPYGYPSQVPMGSPSPYGGPPPPHGPSSSCCPPPPHGGFAHQGPPQPAMLRSVAVTTFSKIWDDWKTGSKPHDGSFFRPIAPPGYYILGDVVERGQVREPSFTSLAVTEIPPGPGAPYTPLLALPVDYHEMWNDRGTGGKFGDCSIWLPVAPPGYIAMGCVATSGYLKPPLDLIRCVLASEVVSGALAANSNDFVWRNYRYGSYVGKYGPVTCWKIHPTGGGIATNCFVVAKAFAHPNVPVYCLKQSSFGGTIPPPQHQQFHGQPQKVAMAPPPSSSSTTYVQRDVHHHHPAPQKSGPGVGTAIAVGAAGLAAGLLVGAAASSGNCNNKTKQKVVVKKKVVKHDHTHTHKHNKHHHC